MAHLCWLSFDFIRRLRSSIFSYISLLIDASTSLTRLILYANIFLDMKSERVFRRVYNRQNATNTYANGTYVCAFIVAFFLFLRQDYLIYVLAGKIILLFLIFRSGEMCHLHSHSRRPAPIAVHISKQRERDGCSPGSSIFLSPFFLFSIRQEEATVTFHNITVNFPPHSRRRQAASQLLSARVCVLDRVNMPLDF